MKPGNLIISLDFELHWGAAERWNLELMKPYFDNTRRIIPLMLQLFEANNIKVTWATVGFLFAKNREQLLEFLPQEKPAYVDPMFNSYNLFHKNKVGECEASDPYHFGYSLIKKILNTEGQELASHTFSHYYCNEPGQNVQRFEEDLNAAQKISRQNFGIELRSLAFPKNQFNARYLTTAYNAGIKIVRSNPDVSFWQVRKKIQSSATCCRYIISHKQTSFVSVFTKRSRKSHLITCEQIFKALFPQRKMDTVFEVQKSESGNELRCKNGKKLSPLVASS